MDPVATGKEVLKLIHNVREGAVSLEKAKRACFDLKQKVSTLQGELQDLMSCKTPRRIRVAQFYSQILHEPEGEFVVLDDFWRPLPKSKQVEDENATDDPDEIGEVADDPIVDPSPPASGENESASGAGTGAEAEAKTAETGLVTAEEGKEEGSSPTTDATSLSILKPDFWTCIGSGSSEQQVLESDSVATTEEDLKKRYQEAVEFISTMIDDTTIPTESDQKEHADEMRDVYKLLDSMRKLAVQMRKTVSTISTFEKDFLETTVHLGVTQNVVMYLCRGQPYEKEFEKESKDLDDGWNGVKEARDEVDKNAKDESTAVSELTNKYLMEHRAETKAYAEDLQNNVVKILELLEKTNKTMSMSLAEQAALRAKTVRESIFNAVVECGKPAEKSTSLNFLRDVCEEYRGNAEVLDWIHPMVGMTAAFYASMNNYVECVEILVQCKARTDLRMPPFKKAPMNEGWSCLTIAASSRSTECVALLLKLGADVNLPHAKSGHTALHCATLRGDVVTVNTILEIAAGSVDLNFRSSRGMSPIYTGLDLLASQSASTLKQRREVWMCISALMGAGAIVQPEAFAFAARRARCSAALRAITSHPKFDANLLSSYVEGHGTMLYCACEGRNYDGMEILIAAGASASRIPGKCKSSPVIFAICCNDLRAVKILLKQPTLNLELETQKSDRKSCLLIAVEKNFLPILSLLVDRLAEGDAGIRIRMLNIADKEGRTPLLLACHLGLVPHVEKLVSAVGCDVDRTDNQFKTPAFIATEKGFYSILVALIKANCNLNRSCGADTPLSWIRAKTADYKFVEEPGDYEFEEEADDEDERYMQIRRLLEKKVKVPPPQVLNCTCLIS